MSLVLDASYPDFYSKFKSQYSFIGEKTFTSSQKDLDWDDFVFRYDPIVDTLRIYFIQTTPEMLAKEEEVIPGVSVMKNSSGLILYLQFSDVKNKMAFHLFDFPESLDGLSPLLLQSSYDHDLDSLYLRFIEKHPKQVHSTDSDRHYEIMLDKDKYGRYLGLEIQSASELLCKRTK